MGGRKWHQRKNYPVIQCKICHKPFPPRTAKSQCCSDVCRRKNKWNTYKSWKENQSEPEYDKQPIAKLLDVDRGTLKGFNKYFSERPAHFKQEFKTDATLEAIKAAFKGIKVKPTWMGAGRNDI